MKKSPSVTVPLYWRYSIHSFTFFIFFAFQVTFLPVLCKILGFNSSQVAWLNTWTILSATVAPALIQIVAHRWVAPQLLFKISVVGTSLLLIPQLWTISSVHFTLLWFFCVLLNRSAMSLTEVMAINESAQGLFRFERVRLWGSFGFIAGTYLAGISLDHFGESSLAMLALLTSLLSLIGIPCIADRLSDTPAGRKEKETSPQSAQKIKTPFYSCFILLLFVNAILYLSQSCYYVFFSLHLRNLGWSGGSISTTWSIGVLLEIAFFAYFPSFEERVDKAKLLRLSIIFNSLRMFILGSTSDPFLICFSQVLHIFSFATLYVSSIRLTQAILPPSKRDRGLGLGSFAAGVGGLIGRLLLSQVADITSIQSLFVASAAISLLAYPLAVAITHKLKVIHGISR